MNKLLLKPALILLLLLAACAQPAPTPMPTAATITATALPPAPLPTRPPGALTPTPTATPGTGSDLFSNIIYSSDVLRRKCPPQEIIFNVTVKDARVSGVVFLFRMKDKGSGITSAWSNGDDMRPSENGLFQFVFTSKAIPNEARYKEAWLQVQFAGIDRLGASLGHSRIYTEEITYSSACP